MTTLFVQDSGGEYRVATPTEIVDKAHRVIPTFFRRGTNVESSTDIKRLLAVRMATLPNEVFFGVFLDARFRLIAAEELFRGTVNGAPVYPRVIVARALALNASNLLVAHQHPSGIAEPSAADRGITARLKEALALVDIRLVDHFIVGGDNVESLAERGWL